MSKCLSVAPIKTIDGCLWSSGDQPQSKAKPTMSHSAAFLHHFLRQQMIFRFNMTLGFGKLWFEYFSWFFFPGCYWLSDQILIQILSRSDLWWLFKHQRRFKLNLMQKLHFFLLIQVKSEVKFAFLCLISTVFFSKVWFWFVFFQILCWEFLMQKNLRRVK